MKTARPSLFAMTCAQLLTNSACVSPVHKESHAETIVAGASTPGDALNGEIVGDLATELREKNVETRRWGERARHLADLRVGMPQRDVEEVLGTRIPHPDDRSIWQYPPDEFRGGPNGPDWNLVIHMKDGMVRGFQLLKYVYGPPPR